MVAWLTTAGLALTRAFGWPAALGLLVVSAYLRIAWPLQLAVLLGLGLVWHWPWLLALLVAAPRLLTLLPGLIAWGIARRRHPPPAWALYQSPPVP